jgi:transcriptional regulator with XRE-family HTH domain
MLQANEVKNGGDLRQWRKERGLNQSRVAHMLLSSQKTISNLENRPFEPIPPKLMHALGVAENPAEARMLGQWQSLFAQVLEHMQAHAMIPNLHTRQAQGIATRLSRHMQDELAREGAPVTYA